MKSFDKFSIRFTVLVLSAFLFVGLWTGCADITQKTATVTPPVAEQIAKELTIHNDTRIDNYFWLRERENPKVIEYLTAENTYLESMMAHTEKLQQKLFNEIVGRIKQTDMSVPYMSNGYFYYSRFEEGKEYPIHCRKKGKLDAPEEILLNVNEMATGHAFYQVQGLEVSEDNLFLAFGVDTVSRRKYTIYFKNLGTGEILPDQIPNTTGGATWANDNKTVFYVTKDSTLRPEKIMKHVLGTSSETDRLIFHETDNTFGTYVYKSKSREFLFIVSGSTLSTEYRFLKADSPDGEFKIVQKREKDHEYSVDHFGNSFYIVTNWQAKNFRLMQTDVARTSKENWKEVIPHRTDVLLEGIDIFKDYLVVSERQNGLQQIKVTEHKSGNSYSLEFPDEAYLAYPTTNLEFDTNLLRYSYTSLTTPNSTYDYNMQTREQTLLKQQEVLGGYDPKNYESKRLYAPATDGTKIPISLVYKKGLVTNGANPLLLYGYGSYGASMDATFSSVRLSLLDRGFVYAIAHIRGGQEMGRDWYENGKLLKKKNTFTDFINCAEFLIAEKYTNQENLFAMGGSAGGLLMGAVVNMRPDLFKGVIAQVPWVDVITTMLDESIPLTTSEYDEWGNPNVKEYYDYMLSYSPYDNVEAKPYPAMLVTTGLHDSQVQYWEPAKWVAKLRTMKTDQNILLLKTDMKAGHGGKSGRFERYKETALEYAFMFHLSGIKN
ncbi:MAG: S9 family peptidase [Candidatus Zhuqueibacterota bacterium]